MQTWLVGFSKYLEPLSSAINDLYLINCFTNGESSLFLLFSISLYFSHKRHIRRVSALSTLHWSPIPKLSIGSILPRLPVPEDGPLSEDPCQLKEARRLYDPVRDWSSAYLWPLTGLWAYIGLTNLKNWEKNLEKLEKNLEKLEFFFEELDNFWGRKLIPWYWLHGKDLSLIIIQVNKIKHIY